MTETAKRKIHKFDFDGDGAHVALVGPAVGGAANGYTTLITKATSNLKEIDIKKAEVRVDMSFRDFLTRFLYMYYEEAIILCELLGYDSGLEQDSEWYREYIDDKMEGISLLKSASQAPSVGDWVTNLSDEDFNTVFSVYKSYKDKVLASDLSSEGKKSGDSITKSSATSETNEEIMSDDIKTLEKELEKARSDAAAASSELEELRKSKIELEELRKAKEAIDKEQIVSLVKSLSFVEEGQRDATVESLLKFKTSDNFKTIEEMLTKAQAIINEFGEEVGSQQTVTKGENSLKDLIKAKYGK